MQFLALVIFLIFNTAPSAHASKKSDKNPQTHIAQANLYFQKGDFDQAILQSEIARDLNPSLAAPYIILSKIYTQQQKTDKALDILLQCLGKAKEVPESILDDILGVSTENLMMVVNLHKETYVSGAKGISNDEIRGRIVSALKSRPRFLLLFAEKFVRQKNSAEALKLLETYSGPENLRWFYQFLLAKCFYLTGRKDDLEKCINDLVLNPPPDALHLYELGRICLKSARDEDAEKFLLSAKKSADPKDTSLIDKINAALTQPSKIVDDDNPD